MKPTTTLILGILLGSLVVAPLWPTFQETAEATCYPGYSDMVTCMARERQPQPLLREPRRRSRALEDIELTLQRQRTADCAPAADVERP